MEIFVGKNDKQYGPFPIEKVNESIANGEFSLDDVGWYEGLGEWKPLRNIEGIVGATAVPSIVSNTPNNTGSPTEQVPSHLVWGILVTLCCCLPFGIVSIVYASKVDGFVVAGDIEKAKENSKKAAMWAWISFGLGIVFLIVFGLIEAMAPGAFEGMEDFDGSY
ncbi:MAG: CD225/dispanin family protein [Verrucomicrobiales bacterium]|nr:CD225/dispanin family protein [Verrucomicrobiales bacterium]